MSSHGTELGISEIITLAACKGFDRVFATFHEDWNPHDDEVLSPFPVLLEQECKNLVAKLNLELCLHGQKYKSFRPLASTLQARAGTSHN